MKTSEIELEHHFKYKGNEINCTIKYDKRIPKQPVIVYASWCNNDFNNFGYIKTNFIIEKTFLDSLVRGKCIDALEEKIKKEYDKLMEEE